MKIKRFNETNEIGDSDEFGVERDGWNGEDLFDLKEILGKFQNLKYEIDKARRGSVIVDGDTTQDLVNLLKELHADLSSEIDNIEFKLNLN